MPGGSEGHVHKRAALSPSKDFQLIQTRFRAVARCADGEANAAGAQRSEVFDRRQRIDSGPHAEGVQLRSSTAIRSSHSRRFPRIRLRVRRTRAARHVSPRRKRPESHKNRAAGSDRTYGCDTSRNRASGARKVVPVVLTISVNSSCRCMRVRTTSGLFTLSQGPPTRKPVAASSPERVAGQAVPSTKRSYGLSSLKARSRNRGRARRRVSRRSFQIRRSPQIAPCRASAGPPMLAVMRVGQHAVDEPVPRQGIARRRQTRRFLRGSEAGRACPGTDAG